MRKNNPLAGRRTRTAATKKDGTGLSGLVQSPGKNTIAGFEELLADLEDLAAIAERKYEPTITHEDLQAQLKNDGLL